MFTDRELKLLAILLSSEEWISGKILSDMLNIRSRTLQSEIANINSIFKNSSSARIASNNRLGYRLEGNTEQLRKYVRSRMADYTEELYQNVKNILTILLYEKDYLTLNNLAEKAYLAPSSVSFNLERVKALISRTKNAQLKVHPRKGYRIEASEYAKRVLIINALSEKGSQISSQYPEIIEGYELLEEIKHPLAKAIVSDNYIIEGKAFDALLRFSAFSITRQLNGYILEKRNDSHPINPISEKLAAMFEKELNYCFSQEELLCLDERIEELNIIGTAKRDFPSVETKIKEFLDLLESESGLKIAFRKDKLKQFSEHLYRMRKRADIGNYFRIPDPELIEKQYPVALHFLRTTFRKVFSENISGSEQRMLVPYIDTFIAHEPYKVSINIVSDQPVSRIYRYRDSLYETYGSYLEIIRIFPEYLYRERFSNRDNEALFFTTEERLVFEFAELTYIGLYEDEYQKNMILKKILDRGNELKRKNYLDYGERFKNEQYTYKGKEEDCLKILESFVEEKYRKDLSFSIIDNSCLLVINHGKDRHLQKDIAINDAVYYDSRKINRILYFNIGKAEDANRFCEYVTETVNRRE